MIRNTDISNTEDDIVGKRGSDSIEDKNDVAIPKGRFLFREPIVLISIVCLSLLNGFTIALQNMNFDQMSRSLIPLWSLSASVTGLIFAAFISEVSGRKPVYIYLFSLSILSSILNATSKHTAVMSFTFILQGIVRGGTSVMNALAISEYSSPKHRFAWMIVNVAAWYTAYNLTSMTYEASDADVIYVVLLVIEIVLGLTCLGSTWVWPESPYWLASKGKLEESKMAFMWLRGEGGREELVSMFKARRRSGPPKLFWTGLLIAFATMSVSIFSFLQEVQYSMFYHRHNTYGLHSIILLFSSVVIFSVIAVLSYLIRRKLLFITVSGISFTLSYAVALWMYKASESDLDSVFFYAMHFVSDVIHRCGPSAFGIILFIEIAPQKYNTTISCICFIVMFLSTPLLRVLTVYLQYALSFHPSALFASYTTLSLVVALLYYFFAPETKGLTLLEIQRTYTPNENDSNPEQNQSMMLNVD